MFQVQQNALSSSQTNAESCILTSLAILCIHIGPDAGIKISIVFGL